MIKFNAAIRNGKHRILRIRNVRSVIDHFRNTLSTGNTHRDHNKYHRKHHEAHQNIHAVTKQC